MGGPLAAGAGKGKMAEGLDSIGTKDEHGDEMEEHMQIIAATAFGLVLAGSLALIAAMLRAEAGRIAAILSGAELARARAPRAVRVSGAARRPRPARPLRRLTLAAAA